MPTIESLTFVEYDDNYNGALCVMVCYHADEPTDDHYAVIGAALVSVH